MTAMIIGNKNPLYRQVAQVLRERIRTGDYTQQAPLPPVRRLAEEMKVSLNVIQRAIRVLEQEGILTAHHGKAVSIDHAEPCTRAAITFGLIHPFSSIMQMHVLHYAEQAFSERDNFVVVRNSYGDPAREREIAEHLIANGVRGLLVWPTEESPNGQFFQRMAKRLPLVLVDRLLAGADLPAVVHQMQTVGECVCRHMLQTLGCRRLLALVDRNDTSSHRDLITGLRHGAASLDRPDDVAVHRLPLVELVNGFNTSDFSQAEKYARRVAALLEEGYDGLFCPQSEFIDFALVQSGLFERFNKVRLGTIANPAMNQRSRAFVDLKIAQWSLGHAKAIALAADLLQQWILSRQRPRGVQQIAVENAPETGRAI